MRMTPGSRNAWRSSGRSANAIAVVMKPRRWHPAVQPLHEFFEREAKAVEASRKADERYQSWPEWRKQRDWNGDGMKWHWVVRNGELMPSTHHAFPLRLSLGAVPARARDRQRGRGGGDQARFRGDARRQERAGRACRARRRAGAADVGGHGAKDPEGEALRREVRGRAVSGADRTAQDVRGARLRQGVDHSKRPQRHRSRRSSMRSLRGCGSR